MKIPFLILLALGTVAAFPNYLPEKIIGGTEATKGEFPHIVQIRMSGNQLCGGSIVNENWIVTSAICTLAPIEYLTVVAGEHNLTEEEGTEQHRQVVEMIAHPGYGVDPILWHINNIGVMKVDEPFTYNSYVGPAILLRNSSFSPGDKVTTAGWGWETPEETSYSDVLMKITLPIVSYEACRTAHQEQLVDDQMICAGEDGLDVCYGDAGGPLMSGSSLAGTISWGHQLCAEPGYPGVYTDANYFADWIRENTT